MPSMTLVQYISFMQGIGKTYRQTYQGIKRHYSLKYSTNTAIDNAFNLVNAMKGAASKIDLYAPKTKLTRAKIPGVNLNTNKIAVGFSFDFASKGSARDPTEKKLERHFTIEVPVDATKGDLNKLLSSFVKDWIANNYEGKRAGAAYATINITDARGI